VDGCSIDDFETDLKNNLYKIWNRMSSGTYFRPPVRAVQIPKPHGGGKRMLGIPTAADRVAQTVAALALAPRMESIFHDDSYGYRPGRSPLDAVATCRRRCWKKDWIIDCDVQNFFDSVDHDRMVKAVEANTTSDQRWVMLYVKRWLVAPIRMPDGKLAGRDRGTPQGSAISPVLANLFLHYTFDTWLDREFPAIQFERFADDAVVHCATERQARHVLAALETLMTEVGLALHPEKTRIVYCKDRKRRLDYEHTSSTFCGYTFRARKAPTRDGESMFTAFLPAVSRDALKKMSNEVRRWRINLRTTLLP
jgi:RNA-directed DNA polymerase